MAEAEESLAEVPLSEEINDTDDDEPIWLPHEDKHRRMSYIPLPGVLRTFPDISPAKLCELADLKAVAPSKVLAIVPTASVTQLCDFCKLAESLQVPDEAVAAPPPRVPDPLPVEEEADRVANLLAELKKLKPRFVLLWICVIIVCAISIPLMCKLSFVPFLFR